MGTTAALIAKANKHTAVEIATVPSVAARPASSAMFTVPAVP